MRKKWIAAVMAAAMTLGFWGCASEPDTMVYVENVGTIMDGGAIAVRDKFPGLVVSENLAEIWRDTTQTVAEIYVEQGQDVSQGALLFAYDSEALSLQLSKQELELDRLNNTISTLKSQIAQLEKEQKAADKDSQLSYTVEIQDRQAQQKEAEYNAKLKKKEIEQTKSALTNAKIYAPVAGRVVSVNESGVDSYGNAVPYITIQQTGSYRIQGSINELNMGTIIEGARILVTSRTDEQSWMGVVSSIDLESATQNSTQGDYYDAYDEMTSSSSYNFYVDLESTDGLILGQHVYLEVYTEQLTAMEGLWLPAYYLCQDENGGYFVWAENEDNRLEESYVALGDYDEATDTYEILEGLTIGDYIAFPGSYCEAGAHTTRNLQDAVLPSGDEVPGEDPASPTDSTENGGIDLPETLPSEGVIYGYDTAPTETEETEETEPTEDNAASGGDLR